MSEFTGGVLYRSVHAEQLAQLLEQQDFIVEHGELNAEWHRALDGRRAGSRCVDVSKTQGETMRVITSARALASVLALHLTACGGGGGDPGAGNQQNAPAASPGNLPSITSRYVRLEGRARLLSDPAGRSALRFLFETSILALCNDFRESYGEARQAIPASVLEAMDLVVEENMYDAATGAARKVHRRTMISLTDFPVAVNRAPDCLAYTVHQPVYTTIWGSDGYRYEIRLGAPGSADSAIRFLMGHPDDLNWRVSPVDLSMPRRTIAGASCRDVPTVTPGGSAIIDQCRLEPNDDIVFRVLPLALRDVTVNATLNGVPTASSEEFTLTATSATTDRSRFGDWSNGPVDALPALPPGVSVITQ